MYYVHSLVVLATRGSWFVHPYSTNLPAK